MNAVKRIHASWYTGIALLLLLAVVLVGVVYIRNPQELRKKAALTGSTLSISPSSISLTQGKTKTVGVVLNAGPDSVTGAQLHVAFNPSLIKIVKFIPGTKLPLLLQPPQIVGGTAFVTLGAQPNTYLRGSAIIGSFEIQSLTNGPADVTFTSASMVTVIEKTSNTLISSTGLVINPLSTTTTPIPTCTPLPACAYQTNANDATCKIGATPAPGGTWCPRSTPTITPTPIDCIPLPECVYNPPIVNGRPVVCDLAPPPNGMRYCPRPSVITPTPFTQCAGQSNGTSCTRCRPCTGVCPAVCIQETGTCNNGQCTGPSPTPGACIRRAPAVTINPAQQSGTPGTSLNYTYTVLNNDTVGCGSSSFAITAKVDTGWSYSPVSNTLTNIKPGESGSAPINITSKTSGYSSTTVYPFTIYATNTSSSLQGQVTGAYAVNLGQQSLDFKVKLAGVTDGSAEGATIAVKFVKLGGEVVSLSNPLALTHTGNGIYKASAILTNPFSPGTKFSVKIKGEKHASIEFCQITGQNAPCTGTTYITVPATIPASYAFDFTGIALPPGDVPPQDGKVDVNDFSAIKNLMTKLCSDLTSQEKLKGDLDYNGCVTVRDIFLIRQTLETRYDE